MVLFGSTGQSQLISMAEKKELVSNFQQTNLKNFHLELVVIH